MKLDFPTRAAGRVRSNRRPDKQGRRALHMASSLVEELEPRRLLTRLVGIDVSTYQGTIDWATVKNYKQFAFIRATSGLTTDSRFAANATNALANGLYEGFYHYAYYSSSGHTAVSEADQYFNTIKPYLLNDGKHLMPVLDVEQGTTVAVGGTLDEWCNAWCQRVQSRALNELGLVVTPMIYTSASHAASYFSSGTIPLNYPLWVAAWPGTIPNPQTAQPSGVGDWQSSTSPFSYSAWSFWQYAGDPEGGPTGTCPGVSGACDLDVFQGDANALKTYIVGSAGRWTAGTRVQANSSSPLLKAWSTPGASGTYVTVPNGTKGTIVFNSTYNETHDYGNSFWRWYVEFDNGMSGWVAEYQSLQPTSPNTAIDWLTTVAPSAPTSPSPANSTTAFLTSLPSTFTWTGANASSYDVYLDGVKKTTVTTNSWTPPSIADGTHTWYVVSHNAELSATSATWTFKLDSAAPLATYGGQQPTQNASSLIFTVTYSDPTSGILFSSLDAGDIVVTGPNGYSQAAALVSVDNNTNGTPRTATYSIPAPGGTWDNDDNGSYTLSQVASQVRDVAGNYRPAGTIGSFSLNLPAAYTTGPILVIDYPGPGTISVAATGANVVVTQGSNTYTFALSDITAIAVNTSSGSDTLSLSGSVPPPITFSSSSGSHAITIAPGASASIASDLPGYAVTVASGGIIHASVPLHLASLTLAGGSLALPAGGATPLTVGDLSITSNGQLDLADNSLTWNYTGASPADALRTYLYNGRNGGTWDGTNGIIASSPLGYLDTTSLHVQPTPAGDANLDGQVNADDYALTDRSFAMGTLNPHWLDGDYDYSGSLDANDYFLLDSSASAAASDPYLLAIRLATFGPGYVDALETPAPAAEPAAFSSIPIEDATAGKQSTTLPLQTASATSSFSFASLQSDDIVDDLKVK